MEAAPHSQPLPAKLKLDLERRGNERNQGLTRLPLIAK